MSKILRKPGRDTVTGLPVDVDIAVAEIPDGSDTVAVIDAGQVIDATLVPTLITLTGGIHTSLSITGGNTYRVDSAVDLFVKSSSSAAQYEAVFTDDTDAYQRTGSIAALSELNYGTGDISLEAWVKIDPAHTNAHFLSMGVGSGAAKLEWFIYTAGGYITSQIWLLTTAGANPLGGTVTLNSTVAPVASELHHLVLTLDRTTPEQKLYVDGSLVETEVQTDTAAAIDISASGGDISLGCTLGGVARFGGSLYDLKIYKDLLSIDEVQARTNKGPVTLAADLVLDEPTVSNLATWINFADSANWAGPTLPECVSGYGAIVMDNIIGSPAISEVSTGSAAGTSNSQRVLASQPALVTTASTDTYLNMYSKVGAAGDVYITGS